MFTLLLIFLVVEASNFYAANAESTDHPIADVIEKAIPDCIFGVDSVSYILYRREMPSGKRVNISDRDIPIVNSKETIFLIHGFTSEGNNSNYQHLSRMWLKYADVNIFSLDWSDAACTGGFSITDLLAYNSAVENVPPVANRLAKFIQKLIVHYGVLIDNIMIVGHSLGAHVAGLAGKAVQDMIGQTIPRIIGLDPAGLLYKDKGCSERLCIKDAKFVQIFHTSTLGLRNAIGHIDFYFNGGLHQPGCAFVTCSHSRPTLYLAACLAPDCTFTGTPWRVGSLIVMNPRDCKEDTCPHPGLKAFNSKARGTFYVRTRRAEPYCFQ